MSAEGAGTRQVVVNRAMSVDGFIAGPDHAVDWIFDYLKTDPFPEVLAATGAVLVGRGRTRSPSACPPVTTGDDGGPVFVLTHRPADQPVPGVTFLSCDLAEAVATARTAAGRNNLEILGADLASQCLRRGSSTRF